MNIDKILDENKYKKKTDKKQKRKFLKIGEKLVYGNVEIIEPCIILL
jgi:hypothetical protein